MLRRDDQAIVFDAQLDDLVETTLIDERLGNANATALANTDEFSFHGSASAVTRHRCLASVGCFRLATLPFILYGQRLAASSHPAARVGWFTA